MSATTLARLSVAAGPYPSVGERVYRRVVTIAEERGLFVRTEDFNGPSDRPSPSITRAVLEGETLCGFLVQASPAPERRAFELAVCLGFPALGSWAPWNRDDSDGPAHCWEEAHAWATALVGGLTAEEACRGALGMPERDAFDLVDRAIASLCGRLGVHPVELIALRYGEDVDTGIEPDHVENSLREAAGAAGPLGQALARAGHLTAAEGEWLDRGMTPMPVRFEATDGELPLYQQYYRGCLWRDSKYVRPCRTQWVGRGVPWMLGPGDERPPWMGAAD